MQKAKSYRNLILGCCMTGIAMFLAFFFLYHTYIQDIIYEERLNQMEEVTRQIVSKSGGCDRFPLESGNGRM